MGNKKIVVAIDGYSSCGKSTFAKMLARDLKYVYIDTGAMYRAVAYYGLTNGFFKMNSIDANAHIRSLPAIHIQFEFNMENGVSETMLNGKNIESEIRNETVSAIVSEVSSIKEVRKKLVQLQQQMGKNKGIVMDGRDIGTVVFPDAEIKIFMTADPGIRARRRYDELIAKGEKVTLTDVESSILERDKMDMNRKESPLKQAEDAYVLDNTTLSLDDQIKWFHQLFGKQVS